VALHTGSLPDKTLRALAARDIPTQRVPYLCPGPQSEEGGNDDVGRAKDGDSKDHAGGGDTNNDDTWYAKDPRFRVCFTKLAVFSLTAYDRVVMLDADMLVRRNMDELFDVPLDEEDRLFAATGTWLLLVDPRSRHFLKPRLYLFSECCHLIFSPMYSTTRPHLAPLLLKPHHRNQPPQTPLNNHKN
jgi:hypothetical protein